LSNEKSFTDICYPTAKKITGALCIILIVVTGIGLWLVKSLDTYASSVAYSLSAQADDFLVVRRVTFYDALNNRTVKEFEGLCSINVDQGDVHLELICKTGEYKYKKHYMSLNNNLDYIIEQIGDTLVDPEVHGHYEKHYVHKHGYLDEDGNFVFMEDEEPQENE